MNFIKKSSLTIVVKTLTLGFFGLIVCRNLAAFTMQKLKSLHWFCWVRISTSTLWLSCLGEQGQAEARQLPRVEGRDGLVPLNTIVDAAARKMAGKTTMPCVPPNSGPARRMKKSVSINENVEEIIPNKKRNRKIHGIDNEDVKPFKSILKVGSRLREKQ